MDIIEAYDGHEGDQYFEVLVEPGFSVTVKRIPQTGLTYVMQNRDGSEVHQVNDPGGPSFGRTLTNSQRAEAVLMVRSI